MLQFRGSQSRTWLSDWTIISSQSLDFLTSYYNIETTNIKPFMFPVLSYLQAYKIITPEFIHFSTDITLIFFWGTTPSLSLLYSMLFRWAGLEGGHVTGVCSMSTVYFPYHCDWSDDIPQSKPVMFRIIFTKVLYYCTWLGKKEIWRSHAASFCHMKL